MATNIKATRRTLMKSLAAMGIMGSSTIGLIRAVLAGSGAPILQGVNQVESDTRINGKAVGVGDPVNLGDRIVTNGTGVVTIVMGGDAFLIRGNSDITLGQPDDTGAITTARVERGSILSVFGINRGTRFMLTPTTSIGIRGTGLYIEVRANRDYVCTCYGEVRISPNIAPELAQTFITRHHDEPRYIYPNRPNNPLVKAPVINHSDAELYMLEGLVKRRPPYDDYGSSGGY